MSDTKTDANAVLKTALDLIEFRIIFEAKKEELRLVYAERDDALKRIAELEETIERLQDSRRRRVQKESDAAWDRGEET